MKSADRPLHIVMTVLHTSPLARPGSADAGGLNVVVSSTAQEIARSGHKVSLVSRKTSTDMPEVVNDVYGIKGLNAYFLPAGPPHPFAKSETDVLIEPFTQEFFNWWETYGHDVDIIHSHHWFAGKSSLPVAREAKVPHIQSYHSVAAEVGENLEAGEQPESEMRIPGESFCAAHSDLILAVSEAERDMIARRYNPTIPIPVVYPGVDTDMFRPVGCGKPHCREGKARIAQLTNKEPYIFFAARLQPLKGADLAIEALARIPSEERPILIIAGEASQDFAGYEESLHKRAYECGVAENIRYVGSLSRPELACMISYSDVMVTPSYSETFGIINLEAAACGVPVVAWNKTGLKESVINGVTGTLCETRDPEEWAQAIVNYLRDPELRAKHAQAGRRHAQAHTWEAVAEKYVDIYRQCQGKYVK